MKRLFIISLATIILSCNQKQQTNSENEINVPAATNLEALKLYESIGKWSGDKILIEVRLPNPEETNNSYKILKAYNVTKGSEQRLLLHLKDLNGPLPETNLQNVKFEVNAADIMQVSPSPYDRSKDIQVVVYHDNCADSETVGQYSLEFYDATDCKTVIKNTACLESINIPKKCGKGVIKPS